MCGRPVLAVQPPPSGLQHSQPATWTRSSGLTGAGRGRSLIQPPVPAGGA